MKPETITSITRRNIADELSLHGVDISGRLDEVQFLGRVFELDRLPSQDGRFETMSGDIWQHRVNNHDWEDGWWWHDERLNLMGGPDERFLQFLAEMVHPLARAKAEDRQPILDLVNKHLKIDGWTITEVSQIGGHPIYGGRQVAQTATVSMVEAKALAQTLGDYVSRQISRMESALAKGDLELAIGSAKEFIETVCRTILVESGADLPANDDLPALVRLAVRNVAVVPESIAQGPKTEKVVTRLINNLASIGQSLAEIRNEYGTGHGKAADHMGLELHHAKLAVHMSTAAGVFLYEAHERTMRSKSH